MSATLVHTSRTIFLSSLLLAANSVAGTALGQDTTSDRPQPSAQSAGGVKFSEGAPPSDAPAVTAAGGPTLAPPCADSETPKPIAASPAPSDPAPTKAADLPATPADLPPAKVGDVHPGPLVPIPDAKYAGPVDIEVTSFHGVTPGTTTREQVEKAWGAPSDSRKQGDTLMQLFSVKPFSRVEVAYASDRVASIIIRFEHGFPAGQVAEQLDLIKVQPVLISNDLGEILGQSYPERGVLFSFEPAKEPSKALKKVTHIILEPISPEPFVIRAESNLDTRPEFSLHDLDEALKMQATNARAHWLRARALEALGQYDKAMAASAEAVRLDPKDARYLIALAHNKAQAGHVAEAIPDVEKAITLSQPRPHVRARALCLMGDLNATRQKPDYKLALKYHTQAIQAADALTNSPHPAIRIAAKEVLLDAHLGAVRDIAWGDWREKERSVENWLTKANTIVQDLVKNEDGTDEYRFRLATRALSGYVGLQGRADPATWTKELIRAGESIIDAAPDAGRKTQLQWEVAMGLYDSLQIYQMRSDPTAALKYGQLAIDYLEKSGRQNQSGATVYLTGRLYFRMGAIHAIQQNDHAGAVVWFEKSVPLLGKTPPPEAMNDLARLGDTFVSMGVSYWSSGYHAKAIALTQHGASLMEEAVRRGLCDQSVLAVPYTNLAQMNRDNGDGVKAKHMEEMAGRARGTLR